MIFLEKQQDIFY